MVNECSPTNGCVQGYESLWFGKAGSTALYNAAQDGYEGEVQLFLSDTLAPNFNNRSSALAGAARTSLANPLTFIASDAAVAFWFFSATGKELGPRGHERAKDICKMNC